MAKKAANTDTSEEKKAGPAPADKKNGVSRPRDASSKTGRVWAIADELSKHAGEPARRGDVMKAGEAEGLNAATIATQYGRWCKYYGIAARRTKADEAATAEVEA
jgi:hypothetical protein